MFSLSSLTGRSVRTTAGVDKEFSIEVFVKNSKGEVLEKFTPEERYSSDSNIVVGFSQLPKNAMIQVTAKLTEYEVSANGAHEICKYMGNSNWVKLQKQVHEVLLSLNKLINVNFYVDDEVFRSYEIVSGKTLPVPPVPSKDNKLFDFWAINGSTDPFNWATQIYENLDLYAIWDELIFSGNISIDGTEFEKTSFSKVIPVGSTRTIVGSDAEFLASTTIYSKGLFYKGRTVVISRPYAMCQYEVTQELYKSVMGENPSTCDAESTGYPTADGEEPKYKPVETVSWCDAIVFCNKLSVECGLDPCYYIDNNGNQDYNTENWGNILTDESLSLGICCDFDKNGYRLPTEEEWEFAARGGNPDSEEWDYAYSGAQTSLYGTLKPTESIMDSGMDTVGWYKYNLGGETSETPLTKSQKGYSTHEVGKKQPNSLKLYDMSGNVAEWCWDIADFGSGNGTGHVRRGGFWLKEPGYAIVTYRAASGPLIKGKEFGFRLCRTITN